MHAMKSNLFVKAIGNIVQLMVNDSKKLTCCIRWERRGQPASKELKAA